MIRAFRLGHGRGRPIQPGQRPGVTFTHSTVFPPAVIRVSFSPWAYACAPQERDAMCGYQPGRIARDRADEYSDYSIKGKERLHHHFAEPHPVSRPT
jgi:hypothetical protein